MSLHSMKKEEKKKRKWEKAEKDIKKKVGLHFFLLFIVL